MSLVHELLHSLILKEDHMGLLVWRWRICRQNSLREKYCTLAWSIYWPQHWSFCINPYQYKIKKGCWCNFIIDLQVVLKGGCWNITNVDPNPGLYQAPRWIKSLTSSQVSIDLIQTKRHIFYLRSTYNFIIINI